MSLLRGLSIQRNVIWALILRETRTRFGTFMLGYLWALLEPVILIITFYIIFKTMDRLLFTNDIINFLITGLIPFLIFKQVAVLTSNAIDANKALLYYPQVKIFDLMIARALLEIWTLLTVTTILVTVNYLYHPFKINQPMGVLLSLITAGFLGLGVGIITASLTVYIQSIKKILHILIRIIFFASCVFYSPKDLPLEAQRIVFINPLVHIIEMTRNSWFASYSSRLYSCDYILTCSIYIIFISLVMLSISKNKIQVLQ